MTELNASAPSTDDIANDLVYDSWDGDWHRFEIGTDGSLTVNVTGLTAEGRELARAALSAWSDVIGVDFVEVTSAGEIVFDDFYEGVFTDVTWANHVTSSASINVSWETHLYYGDELNSFTYQNYLHQIGHALGLGHADAALADDVASMTVMSQFDENENLLYGANSVVALTPMLADIVAVQTLYGISTSTRPGDTTYGYNSNAGPVYDAAVYPDVAFTIYDTGGTDTLDYSESAWDGSQIINLNPETFSNVAGGRSNLAIARGVVIENAIGGAGFDSIVGNSADNLLIGGGGSDIISYATATAGVIVDLSITTDQDTVGAGRDSIEGFEHLVGSSFDDALTASASTESIRAGSGNDLVRSAAGADANAITAYGDQGDDTFILHALGNHVEGGSGFDIADFSNASESILRSYEASTEALFSIERIIGSAFDDNLAATGPSIAGDIDISLLGGAGNDRLHVAEGIVTLEGGAGDDLYVIWGGGRPDYGGATIRSMRPGTAIIEESESGGTDSVQSEVSYTLAANVENLTLVLTQFQTHDIDGYGNSLANVLTGNVGANVLSGLDGDDRLYGAAGKDELSGGAGFDRMYGGTGDDMYIVSDATDYVYESAGEGADRVYSAISHALRSNVEELRLQGSAAINGYGGVDDNVIYGNSAANKLNGWGGDDKLYGEGGNDRLYGTDGDDRLFGEAGNDRLDGGAGVDRMYGGGGDDIYIARDPTNFAYEQAGEGMDTVYSYDTHILRENIETLRLTGSDAINGWGNAGDDTIVGNGAANRLIGQGGDDRLFGGHGNDRLYGDEGDDRLDGGAGLDLFFGGSGADDFMFGDGDFAASSADRILDFRQAEDDRIHLSTIDANATLGGDQGFAFIGTGDFTGTAGELRYQQINGNTYVYGDTNGDGATDFLVRVDGLHTLESGDFIL